MDKAFKLETLRDSAKSEFQLRGPFPNEAYSRIMHSTKHMLDSFYAMRLLTLRHEAVSAGERALLLFTHDERVRLCHRICHVLQVLASSIMLEYPLTDAVPTIASTKDQLLGKMHRFRKDHMVQGAAASGRLVVEEKDFALLYAYVLVTVQVAGELDTVKGEIEGLFGVLDQEERLLE